jgi:quinol-cytochrome oxidoreductase complex cytochrome b subunit
MSARNSKLFLSVTAFVEAATGLCLLILPAVLFAVLLGLDPSSVDAIFVGRLAGAALLAIGVASWMARTDERTLAHRGLLTGILVYNTAASLLLAYAGAILKMVGVLLWPAVAIHAILAVWCFCCLQPERHGKIIH